jgi:hypothetical protein
VAWHNILIIHSKSKLLNQFIKLQLDEKKILLDNIHVIALVNDPETSFKEKDWGIDRLKDIMAATSAKFGLWTNTKERTFLAQYLDSWQGLQ